MAFIEQGVAMLSSVRRISHIGPMRHGYFKGAEISLSRHKAAKTQVAT